MADNLAIKSDASTTVGTAATDEVPYSGQTVHVQLIRLVRVLGSEGARTVHEIVDAYGLQVNPGHLITPADAQITRPADTTAYAVGDLIANSTAAGSVTRLSWTGATRTGSGGGSGRIIGFVGRKSGTVAATIRYHFLKTDHAVTNGDNGALVLTSLDVDNYFGYMDVIFDGNALSNVGSGGGSVGRSLSEPVPYVLSSTDTIYCVMQAVTAFTPASGETLGGRPIFEVRS